MSKFLKDTSFSILQRLFGIISSFLVMVMIARALGPEGQGSYALLAAIPKTLFNVFVMGFPASFLFLIGKNEFSKEQVTSTFLSLFLLASVVATFFGAIFYLTTADSVFSGIEPFTVWIVITNVCLWYLMSFFGLQLQRISDFKNLALNQMCASLVLLLGISTLFFMEHATILNCILVLIVSVVVNIFLDILKLSTFSLKLSLSKNIIRQIKGYSFKAHLGSLSDFLMYRADMYIIAYYLQKSSVGIYAIAVNLVERIWIFSESLSKVLFVKLTQTEDENRRNMISVYSIKLCFVISVVLGLGLALVAALFISIFFGDEYAGSVSIIYILLPGVVFQSMGITIKRVLEARGYPGTNAKASLVGLVMNVVLNIVLIPRYEIEGAAVASLVSYTIFFDIQLINMYRKFKLKPWTILAFSKKEFISFYRLIRFKEIPEL